jgi:glutathione S-transferase
MAEMPAGSRLLISSRNYSSWSLRGWLLCGLAGLKVTVEVADPDHPDARAELLNKTSSTRLPCLVRGPVELWDTLAIAEYLNETFPAAGMLPEDPVARAYCRSVSGEMHAGFSALRTALPMNLKAEGIRAPLWSAVRADVDRITGIWRDGLGKWGGPWLFGAKPSIADAMFAPVATRFRTYSVGLDPVCQAYADHLLAWPPMLAWIAEARLEPEEIAELEVEADF